MNFNRLNYFVAVVDAGTITGAADTLRISKAVVSKQILTLEEELGTTLLHRNTRNLYPTDAGRRFYEQAKAALVQVQEAYVEVQSGRVVPEGDFRITAPIDYGTLHLAPLVAQFVQDNKKVSIDLHLSDQHLDPVEHHFDLSFRLGWPSDSSNQMRKIAQFEEWVVASPNLTADVSEPQDLSSLSFVANAALKNATEWQFEKDGRVCNVSVNSSLKVNASPAITNAIVATGHISVLPDFLVFDEVSSGRMVRLLPDWSLRSGGIYAMTPPTRHKPMAIKALIDLVKIYHRTGFGHSAG